MRQFFLLFFLISALSLSAQATKKELQASRIQEPPVIDGKLDDAAWIEERKAMKIERDDWLTRMSQARIWIDSDQDDVEDEGEVQAMDRPPHRRRLF